MKIALLSDIHANDQALVKVLRDAHGLDPETGQVEFWFLGDFVGRGPSPRKVWDRLQNENVTAWIAGNWDWALAGKIKNITIDGTELGDFTPVYWKALQKQREQLTESGDYDPMAEFIIKLPLFMTPRPGVYLAHGGFNIEYDHRVIGDYMFANKPDLVHTTWSDLRRLMENGPVHQTIVLGEDHQPPVLLISGHTHRQSLIYLSEDRTEAVDPLEIDKWYPLSTDSARPVYINPGGVGFPRGDEEIQACYAVLDLDQSPGQVLFRRVSFNVDETCRMLKQKYEGPEFFRLRKDLHCAE